MQDPTTDFMTGLGSEGPEDYGTPTSDLPGRPGHTPRMRNTTFGGFIGQGWNTPSMQDPMTDSMSDQDSEVSQDYDSPARGMSGQNGETPHTYNTTPCSFLRKGRQTPSMYQDTTSRGMFVQGSHTPSVNHTTTGGMSGQGVQAPTMHNTTTGGKNAQGQHTQWNFKTPSHVKVGRDEQLPPVLLRGHGIRQSAQVPQASLQSSAPSSSDIRRPSFPFSFNAQSYRANQALPPTTSGNMGTSGTQYRSVYLDPSEYSGVIMPTEQDSMVAQNPQNMHRGMPQEQHTMMVNNAQNMHRGIPPQMMMRPNMDSNVFRGRGEMTEDEIDGNPSAVSPTNTYSTLDISDNVLPSTPVSNRKYHMYNNAHGNAFFHQQQQPESPTPMNKMPSSTRNSSNADPLMMFSGNDNMHPGNVHPGVSIGQPFNHWDPRFFSPGGTFNTGYPPSNMAMNNLQNMAGNPGMVHWQLAANSQLQGFNFPMEDRQRFALDQQRPEPAHLSENSQQPVGPGTRYTNFQQPASGHHAVLRPREQPESTTQALPPAIMPQGPNTAAPPPAASSITLSAEERQREREQRILLEGKEAGKTYKQIQAQIGTDIAESTLRGRWRMMSKAKRDRVRKPIWTNNDIRLLRENVAEQMNAVRDGRDGRSHDYATRLSRVSWKRVGEYIHENGGSYSFGTATCKKKFLLLQKQH